MRSFWLSLFVFLLFVGLAKAKTIDGNSIFETCQSNTQVEQVFCFDYTIGVWEGILAGIAQVLIALKPKNTANLNA
jgi:hypothetical protein